MRLIVDPDKGIPLAALRRWIESWLPGPPLRLTNADTQTGTTPGSVTLKLPVYDENGALLGYLPVYDDIA